MTPSETILLEILKEELSSIRSRMRIVQALLVAIAIGLGLNLATLPF